MERKDWPGSNQVPTVSSERKVACGIYSGETDVLHSNRYQQTPPPLDRTGSAMQVTETLLFLTAGFAFRFRVPDMRLPPQFGTGENLSHK